MNIEVDDDVGRMIRVIEHATGQSASTFLRRLLDPAAADNGAGSTYDQEQLAVTRDRAVSPDVAMLRFVQSDSVRFLNTATDRYLAVLSFAHQERPDSFDRILELGGRTRKYFGRSYAEIDGAGSSTHPQQIPHTPFWAMTNADTQQKQQILRRALLRLGYGPGTAEAACRALD
jgi:negative modulator of initiation of replication